MSVATSHATAAALEEVIVTAQKREESIQNTPISLAAFSETDLETKGINGLSDLHSAVPNLQLTPHPNSSATTRVFMRGIGNNDDQITQDPGVAVYLDGVYIARSQGMGTDVADIERVEVLRGPQGSLYGRNATGGAINFITRAPELGRFGFQQDLAAGSDNLLRSRTLVNLPVGEELAVQLSYLRVRKDGFVDNRGTGVDRFGDQDRSAYRIALAWQPLDALDVRYSYDRSAIRDTPVYVAPVPLDDTTAARPSAGSPFVGNLHRNDIVVEGHNLTASWDLDEALTLKSIAGYRKVANETYQNYLTGAVGPFPLFTNYFDTPTDQFSEELQAVGDALDSQLAYVAGLFFMRESADSYSATTVPSGVRTDRFVTAENKAYAAFGQLTYTPEQLDSRLHVTVGLRQSRDERAAGLQNVTVLASGASVYGQPGDGDRTFNNFSPSVIVSYDAAETVNLYAKAVKGYKTGGYNVRASTIQRFEDGFGEENLVSYETGIKSQWWDNRIRVNGAIFRADYDDIQVSVQSEPGNITVTDVLNAGKATIDGAELDLSIRPLESLTLSFNYAYLDASFDRIEDASGNNVAAGYRFINAPHNSYTATLQYDLPALPFGKPSLTIDYSWQDDEFSNSNDPRYITQSYGLLNARLGIGEIAAGPGEVRVALWGRNLEDKSYYTQFANSGLPAATFGDPRSYGIDLTYKY
jgi:iron complex outermembrane receptor protein